MSRNNHDDWDRERPSWREIDRRRDRPQSSRREPKKTGNRWQQEKIKREVLKQAEALFAGKKARPEYKKALAALEDQRTQPSFKEAAAAFLAEYGLPDDWRSLMLFLDYPDPAVVSSALERLKELAPSQSMLDLQGFKGKLRTLALTSRYPEIQQQAENLLAEI